MTKIILEDFYDTILSQIFMFFDELPLLFYKLKEIHGIRIIFIDKSNLLL